MGASWRDLGGRGGRRGHTWRRPARAGLPWVPITSGRGGRDLERALPEGQGRGRRHVRSGQRPVRCSGLSRVGARGQFRGEVETASRVGERPGRRGQGGLVCPPRPAPGSGGRGPGGRPGPGHRVAGRDDHRGQKGGEEEGPARRMGAASLVSPPVLQLCLPMKIICSPEPLGQKRVRREGCRAVRPHVWGTDQKAAGPQRGSLLCGQTPSRASLTTLARGPGVSS